MFYGPFDSKLSQSDFLVSHSSNISLKYSSNLPTDNEINA